MKRTMHTPEHTADQGRHLLSHMGKRFFSLIEFDDQEELLLEIRKHIFGLFLIVLSGTLIALALLATTIALASSSFLFDLGLDNAKPVIALLGFVVTVVIAIATIIYVQLYRSNVVFITNEKIAQILYITLFNRKISQLNIGDVQDVTVSQNGFFAHIFGYGTLVVETAGEQQNYTFSFVPNPYQSAKIIITAHEDNLKQYGN